MFRKAVLEKSLSSLVSPPKTIFWFQQLKENEEEEMAVKASQFIKDLKR